VSKIQNSIFCQKYKIICVFDYVYFETKMIFFLNVLKIFNLYTLYKEFCQVNHNGNLY